MVLDRNAAVAVISTLATYAVGREDPRVACDARKMSGTTVLPDFRRILIVEDDPGCRALLVTLFQISGFVVSTADSVLGATGLIESFQPHVILLDLGLPYRSGASWLAQLKGDPGTAHIPVVILSAIADVLPRSRRELAQAVVSKPFRARALVDTVQAACGGIAVAEITATGDSVSSRPLG